LSYIWKVHSKFSGDYAWSPYFQATSSLAHWTRVLSHGGHPLRHIVVDSTMGQMRVKAALAAIHAIEGHHLFSYGPVMGVCAKPKRKVVSEANSLLKDKRIKRTFFMENRFISPA
jgi:hypothetical protein